MAHTLEEKEAIDMMDKAECDFCERKGTWTTEISYGDLKSSYGKTIKVKFEDGSSAYLTDKGVTLKFTKKTNRVTIKLIELEEMIKGFRIGLELLKKKEKV